MSRFNWKYMALALGLMFVPGCSGFGNPPPEPMGMALEEMRQAQTYDAYAADNPKPLRLNGDKGEQVILEYRGKAQSSSGIQGDIEINIGN
ncbi:hypothetical protein GCM10011352_13420 [Marinobacterium zhoushanense]|uniref:Uncharacterized protein n=1 Tax=Marinobacterium zhoushanense TaxID=1679163 RepID=A0ABQ1KA72_9GAMM|nr:hypothetical protein [Marinobacterium zhoushanense]GGB88720.1 hypothetical protein GCM10011352_13420 [Marinobacterium zhoushanense]